MVSLPSAAPPTPGSSCLEGAPLELWGGCKERLLCSVEEPVVPVRPLSDRGLTGDTKKSDSSVAKLADAQLTAISCIFYIHTDIYIYI